MIYLLMFVVLVATVIINEIFNRNFEKFLLWFDCIMMCLVSALRYNVGLDYNGYMRIYRIAERNSSKIDFRIVYVLGEKIGVEKAFLLLNMISAKVGIPAFVFIGIMAVLTMVIVTYVISQTSKSPILSLLLFYLLCFLQMMNLSRQMLAVAIVMLAVYNLQKDRNILYIVLILVATLIHSSALIGIVFFILKKIKFNSKIYFAYVAISVFCFFSKDLIIQIISRIGIYNGLIDSNKNLKTFTVFPALVIVILTGLYYRKIMKIKENGILLHCAMIVFLVAVIALSIFYFSRITYYFTILLVIYIPELLSAVKLQKEKFIIIVGYIFMMGGIFLNNVTETSHKYIPYNNVIEAVKDGYLR